MRVMRRYYLPYIAQTVTHRTCIREVLSSDPRWTPAIPIEVFHGYGEIKGGEVYWDCISGLVIVFGFHSLQLVVPF
jgi:hypothetical protein